jgi:hypothetical protein
MGISALQNGKGMPCLRKMSQSLEEETIMIEPQHHLMQLATTYPSGAEEWSCPTCGRRFVMTGLPGYEQLTLERGARHVLAWGRAIGTAVAAKIVLDPGDDAAFHTGSKDQAAAVSTDDAPLDDHELQAKLSTWSAGLADLDFGDQGSEPADDVM